MKKMQWISLFLLTLSHLAPAQTGKLSRPTTPPTSREVVDAWITNTENHVVPVAEVMPDDKYSFVPGSGEFKNVGTFAEQMKHLAANNYRTAAKIMEEKPTVDQENEKGPDSITTKTEIVGYVKGSFAALHRAAATIDKKNEVEPLNDMSGTWQRTRLGLAIDAVAHSFDHYGQLVEYLRMNGIVPPDSR
jgi:hypothetical protein